MCPQARSQLPFLPSGIPTERTLTARINRNGRIGTSFRETMLGRWSHPTKNAEAISLGVGHFPYFGHKPESYAAFFGRRQTTTPARLANMAKLDGSGTTVGGVRSQLRGGSFQAACWSRHPTFR